MSRQLPVHHADPISIFATDVPGPSGANNRYTLSGFDTYNNPSATQADRNLNVMKKLTILFQNGHPIDVGVNGITMESLVEIVIDRLLGFQQTALQCDNNKLAVEHFRNGLTALYRRADERTERVVGIPVATEGTSHGN